MGWSQPYKEHFLSLNLMVENYPGTEIWDPDVPWHLNPRVLSVAHMVGEGGGGAAWGFAQDVRTPAIPACWKLESQDATQEESTELQCARSGRHSELMVETLATHSPDLALPCVTGVALVLFWTQSHCVVHVVLEPLTFTP